MGIPAGLLLQRIGYKKTALTAIAVGFIGVGIIYFSGILCSFGVYLSGAFVSGFSMCMLNTVVNPMLNTLGGGGNKGNQLIQFGGALNSIGATIVPVLLGALMGNWQAQISDAAPALIVAMGIFIAAFLVLFFMEIPEPNIEQITTDSAKNTVRFRIATLYSVSPFHYVGVEVGIPNITNLFMTIDLNIDPTTAGTVVGTYWFLMLIGRLIGASVGQKFPAKLC